MDQYNGRNRFGYWPNMTCDSVKLATEGVQYHQQISKDDKLNFFRKTICRAVSLVYESKCVLYGTDYLFCPKNIFHRFPRCSTARVSGRMSGINQYDTDVNGKLEQNFSDEIMKQYFN